MLSLLTLKEAARASVVSHRWRNIWNYLPVLNFDIENIFSDQILLSFDRLTTNKERDEFLLGKTEHFIQSVDSAVHQHRGVVDTFIVRYFLHKKHSHHLDAWIKFAVAAKTKKLHLFLEQMFSEMVFKLYDFPFHLLASSSVEELCISSCSVRPPLEFDGFGHLKQLGLWDTYATEGNINCLLSSCSSLEVLCLVRVKGSMILRIPHSLSQLQRLILSECDDLKRIEIHDINLKCLCYEGLPVDFIIKQSTPLRRAKFHLKIVGKDQNFNFYLDELARKFPHLSILYLNGSGVFKPCSVIDVPTFQFVHLKRLDWKCPEWTVGVKMQLLHLSTILDAAPFLIDLRLTFSMAKEEEEVPERLTKLVKQLPSHPHSHLESVMIYGFFFERWQLQIILYLLKNATELVSMILEKGRETTGRRPYKEINETDLQKLTQEVPASVKFMIM